VTFDLDSRLDSAFYVGVHKRPDLNNCSEKLGADGAAARETISNPAQLRPCQAICQQDKYGERGYNKYVTESRWESEGSLGCDMFEIQM